jgi:hypothetical protein
MTISRNISVMAQGANTAGVLSGAYGGSLAWQSVQTGNFTAVAGNAYPVNTTSGAVTVTLPASPIAGQAVQLTDYAGTWATNNVTIAPNGSKINSSTSNSSLNISRQSVSFVYVDATQGWLIYSGFIGIYGASFLIVAGGGGGGGHAPTDKGGAGGGAGGLLVSTNALTSGVTYTVTVGAGGVGGSPGNLGANGSNSSFSAYGTVAIGGGGGAQGAGGGPFNGLSGGSGGGAVASGSAGGSPGAGTSGQGYAGGAANFANNTSGGGGAGGIGGANTASTGGNGGVGLSSSITGTATFYASGGGGGAYAGTSGTASAGGGGNASAQNSASNGTSGTANTGGGGGGTGGAGASGTSGGAGGSGVVILSVPTAFYSGVTTGSPTVTTSGANTIIKFTASGSYTA